MVIGVETFHYLVTVSILGKFLSGNSTFPSRQMASTYQVAPLETFKFKTPEDWPK